MKPPVMPIDSFNEKYTPEPYSGCWLWKILEEYIGDMT